MLVKTFGSAVYGIEAITITIEVNIGDGAKPFYLIVGLPPGAVQKYLNKIYPANVMLIASMNPCLCEFYNHPEKECTCNSIIGKGAIFTPPE